MPNWCFTSMLVAGNKREVRKFAKAMRDNVEGYDLNKLLPLDPRTYVESTRTVITDGVERTVVDKSFATMENDGFDGYAHAMEMWGTKWGACSVCVDDEDSYPLFVRFESAWSPATDLIMNLSKHYPTLVFSLAYDEEAHDYCGWETIANGKLIEKQFVDTYRLPEWLTEIHKKAEESEDWDDYYEAHNEWRHENLSRVHDDYEVCLTEYITWRKKAERQRKAGRYVESFVPSV